MFLDMSSTLGANLSSSPLRPSIEYANIIMRDDAGNAYLKNIGSLGANGYVFSGQGLLTNGVDQSVTIDINANVGTIAYMTDGVLHFDEVNTFISTYTIDGNTIHQNYIFYDGTFTDNEKIYLEKYPETFLYYDNGEIKTQSTIDVSKVISWLPLNEFDEYVRDYVKLSETPVDLIVNGDFSNGTTGWDVDLLSGSYQTTTDIDGKTWLRVVNDADADNPNFSQTITVEQNKYYKFSFDVKLISSWFYEVVIIDDYGSTVKIYSGYKSDQNFIYYSNSSTSITIIINLVQTGNTSDTIDFANFSCLGIGGLYQIINFTSSCRTDANYLSYGLQNIFYGRDSNGVINSYDESKIYGNKGVLIRTYWILDITKSFSIEYIYTKNKGIVNGYELFGNHYSEGLMLGEYKWSLYIPYGRIYNVNIPGLEYSDKYLITHTFDAVSSIAKTYQNGVLVKEGSVDTSIATTLLDVKLMQYDEVGKYQMFGTLDLFKKYNKVLTDEERQANYDKYKLQGLV